MHGKRRVVEFGLGRGFVIEMVEAVGAAGHVADSRVGPIWRTLVGM